MWIEYSPSLAAYFVIGIECNEDEASGLIAQWQLLACVASVKRERGRVNPGAREALSLPLLTPVAQASHIQVRLGQDGRLQCSFSTILRKNSRLRTVYSKPSVEDISPS